jgi:hypothetical protein
MSVAITRPSGIGTLGHIWRADIGPGAARDVAAAVAPATDEVEPAPYTALVEASPGKLTSEAGSVSMTRPSPSRDTTPVASIASPGSSRAISSAAA